MRFAWCEASQTTEDDSIARSRASLSDPGGGWYLLSSKRFTVAATAPSKAGGRGWDARGEGSGGAAVPQGEAAGGTPGRRSRCVTTQRRRTSPHLIQLVRDGAGPVVQRAASVCWRLSDPEDSAAAEGSLRGG